MDEIDGHIGSHAGIFPQQYFYEIRDHVLIILFDLKRLDDGHRRALNIANGEAAKVYAPDGLAHDGLVVCQLLKKAYLSARGGDRHLIVLLDLFINEAQERLACAQDTFGGEMQVVYEEKDGAPAIERHDRAAAVACAAAATARRRQLRFFVTASGHDALEERDRLRLAVNAQLKLFRLQVIDKASLFVEDHHVRLHQIGADAHDILALSIRRCLGRRRLSRSLLAVGRRDDNGRAAESRTKRALEHSVY